MRYTDLTDAQFIDLLFRDEDRLGTDFLEEAKRRRDALIAPLCDILKREANYRCGDARDWAVVHAAHLLGIFAAAETIDVLLAASRLAQKYDFDWIWEALPECYLRFGPAVLPRLMAYVRKNGKRDPDGVLSEIEGIWNLWEAHPELQPAIERFFLDLLESGGNHPTLRAHVIADLALIGRGDLLPLFENHYQRGEVDLETLPREDMESFLSDGQDTPGFRYHLESFYDEQEIEARRQRWEEEAIRDEERSLEDYILDNRDRIRADEPCPCGSGREFLHCHLPWADAERERYRQARELRKRTEEARHAVTTEREMETWLRQHLHAKGRLHLFDGIKTRVLDLIKAPEKNRAEIQVSSHLLKPILEQIAFADEKELNLFLHNLMAYHNALAAQFEGHPRNGRMMH